MRNVNSIYIAKVNNQQGFVLIVTLVMLSILTILGVMALDTTNTELGITTNYRAASDAFVGAETVMEFAKEKIVKERSGYQLKDITELPAILPPGVTLLPSSVSINEIDFYTGPPPKRVAKNFSLDGSSRGNIFRSTGGGESGTPFLPYYRTTVETDARGRAIVRLEALHFDLSGL
jgi:hypothetical protein